MDWASVYHPESNGQVKRANRLILQGIKTHIYNELKIHAGRWVDKLPSLLWSLRTSVNHSTGYTPFFLIYGAEAVIPSDLDFDAPCILFYVTLGIRFKPTIRFGLFGFTKVRFLRMRSRSVN